MENIFIALIEVKLLLQCELYSAEIEEVYVRCYTAENNCEDALEKIRHALYMLH